MKGPFAGHLGRDHSLGCQVGRGVVGRELSSRFRRPVAVRLVKVRLVEDPHQAATTRHACQPRTPTTPGFARRAPLHMGILAQHAVISS